MTTINASTSIAIVATLALLLTASCSTPLDIETPRNKIYDSVRAVGPVNATNVMVTVKENTAARNVVMMDPPLVTVDTSVDPPRVAIRQLNCRVTPLPSTGLRECHLRCDALAADGLAVTIAGDPADPLVTNGGRFIFGTMTTGPFFSTVSVTVGTAQTPTTIRLIHEPASRVLRGILRAQFLGIPQSGAMTAVDADIVIAY